MTILKSWLFIFLSSFFKDALSLIRNDKLKIFATSRTRRVFVCGSLNCSELIVVCHWHWFILGERQCGQEVEDRKLGELDLTVSLWAGTSQEGRCLAWIEMPWSAARHWNSLSFVYCLRIEVRRGFDSWKQTSPWQQIHSHTALVSVQCRGGGAWQLLRRFSTVIVCQTKMVEPKRSVGLLIHILLEMCAQADLRPTCHPAWPSRLFCVCRGLSGCRLNPQRQSFLWDLQLRGCS